MVGIGNKSDFNLTHKLTSRHVDFKNKKMNVRLAVQTLSDSTANSLQFLVEQNVPGFSNAEGTIKFIRIWNSTFDIMNTQNINHNRPNKCAINFFCLSMRESLTKNN